MNHLCWGARIGPLQERSNYPPKRSQEEIRLLNRQWERIFRRLGIKVRKVKDEVNNN